MSTIRHGAEFVGSDLTLGLSDSVTASEALALSVTQSLADSVSATETEAAAVDVAQSDSVSPSDTHAADVTLELSDSALTAETTSTGSDATASDSVGTSDAASFDVATVLTDAATATDQVTPESGLALNLSDSVTVTDADSEVLTSGAVTTEPGGWVRRPIRRWHSVGLRDEVTALDAHDFELRKPPPPRPVLHKQSVKDRVRLADTLEIEHDDSVARQEEELVLSLV